MTFPMYIFGNWHAHVSIYQGDGSVAVLHGGVEMGQGINTKVIMRVLICCTLKNVKINFRLHKCAHMLWEFL